MVQARTNFRNGLNDPLLKIRHHFPFSLSLFFVFRKMDFPLTLNSQLKRLYSEIINTNKNNDIDYLISARNYVLIISKNSDKAMCYKRIESEGNEMQWKEHTYDDAREALSKFQLDYLQDDDGDEDYEEDESSSKDGTNNEIDELDGIPGIFF